MWSVLACPFDKQPNGIRSGDALRVGIRIRQRERRQRIGVFGGEVQWFAASSKHCDARGLAQQCLGQAGARVEHLLAVVEDQQCLPLLQVVAHGAE